MQPILDEVKVTKSFRNINVFPQKSFILLQKTVPTGI